MTTGIAPSSVRLDSTTLATAVYDDRRRHLLLDFRDGTRYAYLCVATELFHDLLRATSKGSFFNRHIRGRFPWIKLTD